MIEKGKNKLQRREVSDRILPTEFELSKDTTRLDAIFPEFGDEEDNDVGESLSTVSGVTEVEFL